MKNKNNRNITDDSDVDLFIKKNNFYLSRIKNENQDISNKPQVNLLNTYLMEFTPLGIVIMSYENDVFSYYSNKQIPYRLLESICAKFVVIYQVQHLYTQMNCKTTEIKKKNLPKGFAKLKPDNQLKSKIDKSMNNFKYNGQVKDFCFIKKNTLEKENISYSDFILNKNKKN